MNDVTAARVRYADRLRREAGLHSAALSRAFETVSRERFLGPGPWALWDMTAARYVETPDADPCRVYCDAPVAIDRARLLNNGQPSFVASLIDVLDPRPGEQVAHIGCGTGYYTAILAQIVGEEGRVMAIEYDAELARRAAANLRGCPQATVVHGDGCQHDPGDVDAVLVNAGATHPCAVWLDRLRPGGRLVFPLVRWPTRAEDAAASGVGIVLHVVRQREGYTAQVVSPVMIFPCIGAVDPELDAGLAAAFANPPEADQVQWLRRTPHRQERSCWLHNDRFCLSSQPL